MKKIFLLFILILVSTNCATFKEPMRPKEIPVGDYTYLQNRAEFLSKKLVSGRAKGMSIVIADEKKPIFMQGFGTYGKNKNVDENTIFKIASVSKVFTALGIMKLVEIGKINLDAPLNKYIPELTFTPRKPDGKQPTIRQMLNHHSGISSDIFNGFFLDSTNLPQDYGQEFSKLPAQLQNGYLAQNPDDIMSYSNLSYSLLGVVIEKVSNMKFEDFMQKEIFRPLGMNSTSFLDNLPNENISKGYYPGIFFTTETNPPLIRDLPAGSLSTCAKDMAAFMEMLFNDGMYKGKVLFKAITLKEMYKKQNNNTPFDFDFAIGLPYWFHPTGTDRVFLGHGGDLPPFHAALQISPEHKLGVMVMANTAGVGSMQLAGMGQDLLNVAITTKTGKIPGRKQDVMDISLTPSQRIQNIIGKYVTQAGVLEVTPDKENQVGINLTSLLKLKLLKDGTFEPELKLLGLNLAPELSAIRVKSKVEKGEKAGMISFAGLDAFVVTEFRPIPIREDWKNRVGKYVVVDKNPHYRTTHEFIELIYDKKEDILYMETELSFDPNLIGGTAFYKTPVLPEKETVAYIAGKGRNFGEPIVYEKKNGKEYLRYSGYTFVRK